MTDGCKLGHISEKRVRYYDEAKQYSIAFADVKISDGRIIEQGIIYFDESLVRRVNDYYYEVDICQDTYCMIAASEIIEVSCSSLINSRRKYFKDQYYTFNVSNRTVKESNLPGVKKVVFDLPIKYWNDAKSRNCLVDVKDERLVIQNYQNRTTIIFGQRKDDVKVKFWYQLKDGRWKDETASAGRFWYLVTESKEEKKKLGLW